MPNQFSVILRRLACGIGFMALYAFLDWISYVRPLSQLNVTPWNPAPALALLLLTRSGRKALPLTLCALVVGDLLVRGFPSNLLLTLALGIQLTIGYAALAWILRRNMPEAGMFRDRQSFLFWSSAIIAGTFVNSVVYVTVLWGSGLLVGSQWAEALERFWIGDGVGIYITLPLFWALQDAQRRTEFIDAVLCWETLGYLALAFLTLWIAFVPGATVHFRYFHVLFLPVVWAASRQGLHGAILCVSVLQVGMIFVGLAYSPAEIGLLELQMRAFLLAVVGFLIGVAVDELRRAASELRQSLRLAAAGEMAGALAHELNQPLSALSAYSSACLQLIERDAVAGQLGEVVRRMCSEALRAAEVVRRLRDFFRTGATKLEKALLADIVDSVAGQYRAQAASTHCRFDVGALPHVTISVDRPQIEVVLRNLLANAFEAAAEGRRQPPTVSLTVTETQGGRVDLEVADSGPGLSPRMAAQAFEPFVSTKSSGLGLGLAISRAIAEAHGGSLVAEASDRGLFRLTLPADPEATHP